MIGSLPAPEVLLKALLDALESANIGCTVVVDRGDRLERVYANDALAAILGVDVETARGMAPLAAVPPEERERLEAFRDRLLDAPGGGPKQIETTIERRDGTRIPVEVGLGYGEIDGVRATFAFTRDVSAKAAIEAALRESEERFRRLAEAFPDSITLYAGGRYIYANPIALRLLGIGALEELEDVDPWGKVPPETRDGFREQVERLRRGEPVAPLRHRLVTADGRELLLESSLSLTSIGGVPAVLSCSRDISERVRLQAELMKQDRLASVGILAAGVAHELNNPLAAVTMLARKLREDAGEYGLSDEVRLAVEQIDEAAKRMGAILSDLLFMARPAEQPQAHVDVEKILTSTIALLRAGIPDCPRLRVETDALPPIKGYPSKLGQAFLNVLRNAVQAVEGVPDREIQIRARSLDRRVEIAIHDNGPGIPAALMAHVTEPFFTTKPNGTGLGLWISQALVAHHGGTLDVKSGPGEGTTVTLSLPA